MSLSLKKRYILLFGCCALFVSLLVLLGLLFPEFQAGLSRRGMRELQFNLDQLLSVNTLVFLGLLSVSFLIDLAVLGYGKSGIRNLLKPDKSTRSDLLIFLLNLCGLWRYMIIFSFLLIGYFLGGWARTNLAFEWLEQLDVPIVQLAVYLIAYDFFDYWMHRLSHQVSWWWELHQLHHSATKFNLITVERHHPLDHAFGEIFVAIPMAMLGVPLSDYFIIYLLKSILGYLQHSMVPWRFGLLGKYLVMSPIDHRIHHSPYPEHWDKNYGHFLILWDRLFGSYYAGDFVNEQIGLSNTTDNEKGLWHDMVMGQLRFMKAFFCSKWSFGESNLTPEQIRDVEKEKPHLRRPGNP